MQTISSMPSLVTPVPARKPARYTLLLLVAVFLIPFIAGTGLFWSGWRPDKFGNHGELLQPPRMMPAAGLRHPDGSRLPTAELLGKWLVVLPVSEDCGASCRPLLHQLGQVHIALNKEQSRLQRVFVRIGTTDAAGNLALRAVQREFPGLVVAAVDGEVASAAWSHSFESTGQAIFVVDPLGNVIMRHPDPADMRGLLKDLERLLKYSWIH